MLRRFPARRSSRTGSNRPRAVWVAFGVGIAGLVVSAIVLISALALIGSGEAASAGALQVPVGRISVVVVLGYLIALAVLLVTARTKSSAAAWVLALLAAAIAGTVSLYPLLATASSAVGQASDIVPWIIDLIQRVTR